MEEWICRRCGSGGIMPPDADAGSHTHYSATVNGDEVSGHADPCYGPLILAGYWGGHAPDAAEDNLQDRRELAAVIESAGCLGWQPADRGWHSLVADRYCDPGDEPGPEIEKYATAKAKEAEAWLRNAGMLEASVIDVYQDVENGYETNRRALYEDLVAGGGPRGRAIRNLRAALREYGAAQEASLADPGGKRAIEAEGYATEKVVLAATDLLSVLTQET